MLSHLDDELYPDLCQVVQLDETQRFVYPIFKNGSSAISVSTTNRSRILINEQIERLDIIDVYLREPESRLASGVNTFCQMVSRDNPELDVNTLTWFVEKFLFLNRHYSTQFGWLMNLARYLKADARLSLHDVSDLLSKLPEIEPKGIDKYSEQQRQRILSNPNIEMYIRLDRALHGLCGQDLTWSEIVRHVKQADHMAWSKTVQKNITLMQSCIVQD